MNISDPMSAHRSHGGIRWFGCAKDPRFYRLVTGHKNEGIKLNNDPGGLDEEAIEDPLK
jgi:hypothetical protein